MCSRTTKSTWILIHKYFGVEQLFMQIKWKIPTFLFDMRLECMHTFQHVSIFRARLDKLLSLNIFSEINLFRIIYRVIWDHSPLKCAIIPCLWAIISQLINHTGVNEQQYGGREKHLPVHMISAQKRHASSPSSSVFPSHMDVDSGITIEKRQNQIEYYTRNE